MLGTRKNTTERGDIMKDNRSMVVIAIIMACIVIMMMTIVASAGGGIRTGARAASLYEPHTGTFIYENNSDLRLPMASTTKIMTALLAIEHCTLNESVEIPFEAVGIEGSSLYLKEGDVLTVKDLIYSLLLQSANDAATALAIKISGDISGFAELMNKKAAELGLTNTHFENPHGLDSDEHYTTAKDLALITAAALQNEFFKKVVSTYKYSFSVSGKPRIVVNHNKLLRMYDGALGVKTGYTRVSGRCLVSAAERDGLTLIAVTLDDPDDWRDHKSLLDYGFSQYERVPARCIAPDIIKLPVINSESSELTASLREIDEIKLIKRRDEPEFTATLDVKQYAVAPIKKGDTVGEIIFKKGDEEVLRAPLVANIDVKEKSEKKFGIFDIFDFGR